MDCNGDWGGTAEIDNCEDCTGGNTGLEPDYNDPDDDGVCNFGSTNGDADNCPDTENSAQENYDGDSQGDACDDDDDNDLCIDTEDPAPFTPSPDLDLNGLGNDCDPDDDGDGVLDGDDSHPEDNLQCSDLDDDGCDDCSSGSYDTEGPGGTICI